MPVRIKGKFTNPDKEPLSNLTINVIDEDGTIFKVPALDKRWAPRENFSKYESLVMSGAHVKTGVELQEWQHIAQCVRKNLTFLLACQHHEFWSYMVYQKSAFIAFKSVLENATPYYVDMWSGVVKPDVLELYVELVGLAVRILCRLINNKESPEAWVTDDYLRTQLYENYLISVPMLFDLVGALGTTSPENKALLIRIFDTVLQIEPNYKKDLHEAMLFFRTTFNSIRTQAENEGCEGAGGGDIDADADTPYDDVALYTMDCACMLNVIVEVCPVVRSICVDIQLAHSIASFYEGTIPLLYKNIYIISENAKSLAWLNKARLQYLQAFHNIATSYVEDAQTCPDGSLLPAEMFVALLTECLSEQTFVVDYQHYYPVEKEMDILQKLCNSLDTFKASFVVNAYQKEAEAASSTTIGNILQIAQKQSEPTTKVTDKSPSKPFVNGDLEFPKATVLRNIDNEVTAVLDVLPYLGTGFVRRLLARYENSEEAIAAILEENLPPDLVQADQIEEYIPKDPQDKFYEETGIQHFNVHDGDPYDVLTQDNPTCIIKRGKGFPSGPQNATELLDDKRGLEEIRHRFQEFSLVSDCADDDEYNDEYDDSYDALLESERRGAPLPKSLKAVLANIADISESENENNESEEDASNTGQSFSKSDKNMNFCEDPAVVRARYEARRQEKMGSRGHDNGGNTKSHDVVGAPKGQGQDKETQRNRNFKSSHKSSRANHSRKAGAAFKRSKGMIS